MEADGRMTGATSNERVRYDPVIMQCTDDSRRSTKRARRPSHGVQTVLELYSLFEPEVSSIDRLICLFTYPHAGSRAGRVQVRLRGERVSERKY